MAHMFQTIFWNVFFIKYLLYFDSKCLFVCVEHYFRRTIDLFAQKLRPVFQHQCTHDIERCYSNPSSVSLNILLRVCLPVCLSITQSILRYICAVHCCVITHACLSWSNIWWVPGHHQYMMTSSSGNIFSVTGPLCGEFTGPRWIPLTKASDAKFWYFLWSMPE